MKMITSHLASITLWIVLWDCLNDQGRAKGRFAVENLKNENRVTVLNKWKHLKAMHAKVRFIQLKHVVR